MSRVTVIRTDQPMPGEGILSGVRNFLFGLFDGWRSDDKKGWRRIWKRLIDLEPGEFAVIEFVIPRSGPYHRRHMAIINAVYDAQERINDFDELWIWLKVGSGWVVWLPGAKGGVVPIPKSVSFVNADQHEFEQYHAKVMAFLRGGHASVFLWGHCGPKGECDAVKFARCQQMMDSILEGFGE